MYCTNLDYIMLLVLLLFSRKIFLFTLMLQPIDELFTANSLIDAMLELAFSERAIEFETRLLEFRGGHLKVFSVRYILMKQKFGRRTVKDWLASMVHNLAWYKNLPCMSAFDSRLARPASFLAFFRWSARRALN